MENLEGRGPCYLRTEGISKEQDESLKKAYSEHGTEPDIKVVRS